MSEHSHHMAFPKVPLYSAAALIIIAIVLVLGVRVTGVGDLRTPQTEVIAERMLQFQDHQDGSISVMDASTDEVIERIEPGTNGFLRGTLRGLARDRWRDGFGREPAFRLTGRSDGRLLLEDTATGRLVDLGSFGPTNAAVFARFIQDRMPQQTSPVVPGASAGNPAPSPHPQGAAIAASPLR
ncbi:MAG: photosynthetic complex assembly protein PuhC [Dokdonella sp.]